jgi:hypothetical protein
MSKLSGKAWTLPNRAVASVFRSSSRLARPCAVALVARLLMLLAVGGCGPSFAQVHRVEPRAAGEVTFLDDGSIAVDRVDERCFVARRREGVVVLSAVTPEGSRDLSVGAAMHLQLGFPKSGLLLAHTRFSRAATEQRELVDVRDRVVLLDRETLAVRREHEGSEETLTTRLRISPDGEHFAHLPIDANAALVVARSDTFETAALRVAATSFAFFPKSPRFVALECGHPPGTRGKKGPSEAPNEIASVLRLTVHTLHDRDDGSLEVELGLEARGSGWACAAAESLVIDPTERWAAFVAAKRLVVVDLQSGDLQSVPKVNGPIAFTSHGNQLAVGHDGFRAAIYDTAQLAESERRLPLTDGIAFDFYPSASPPRIVVANRESPHRRLTSFGPDGGFERFGGPGLSLRQLVHPPGTPQLWLVDHEALFVADLEALTVDHVPTDFAPRHLSHLPRRNLLVLDDADSERLFFFDPVTRVVLGPRSGSDSIPVER